MNYYLIVLSHAHHSNPSTQSRAALQFELPSPVLNSNVSVKKTQKGSKNIKAKSRKKKEGERDDDDT